MDTTLVTGASSGIGRSLARRLASGGNAVVAVARRQPLLDSVVEEIDAAGGTAVALACDVTDRGAVGALVHQAIQRLGPIARLVACAGGGEATFVDAFSAAQVERVWGLNVGGTANCIEAVLPAMLARGAGHIVAISSVAAYRGLPTAGAYSAAKAGLSNLMESLRIDLAPRGVDVTLICPGFVRRSPGKNKPFQLDLEHAARLIHRAILARRKFYAFPAPLVVAAGLGRLLPAAWYDRMLAGRGRVPKDKGSASWHP